MVITTEKDKAYFKNLTNLSNSMQAKLEGDTGTLIDQQLSNELRATIKHVSLVASITKAYKQLVRKPDDVAYLAERARLDDFADQRPEISFAVPDCIFLDEIEISFTCGMAKVLTDGNSQAMEERWRNISLERFERIVSADESLVKQTKIFENACITIISCKPIAQDAMLVVKEQAPCFFSPVTQTCRFKVGDDVKDSAHGS